MERVKFRERGYEFVPDDYGWHCEGLGKAAIIVPAGSGFKAYRGNDDVVDEFVFEHFGTPKIFGDQFDAARACVNIWGRFTRVTPDAASLTYEALNDISHDSGAGAGHDAYEVRETWRPRLPEFEEKLAGLTREERQAIAIGEHAEQQAIVVARGLQDFAAMLDEFFNEE